MGLTGHARIAVALAAAPLIAFLWGFAEGTFLFLVPDVFISFVALYSLRRFLLCTATALAGSLLGGAMIYSGAVYFPDFAHALVHAVPFIPDNMFATVRMEFENQGVLGLFNGPVSGTPYKVYALLAPAYVSFLPFMLVSIPVRIGRFLAVGGVAAATAHLARNYPRLSKRLAATHATCWTVFYLLYWMKTGF